MAQDTNQVGPRPKARSNSGSVTLPPSREQLHGCLQFKAKKHLQRYAKIHTKPLVPCKFFDEHKLRELKLWDPVKGYLDNIGWSALLNFAYPAYTEFTQEFYTTLEFMQPDEFTSDTQVLKFRFMNREFKMSYTVLNIALGLVTPEIAHTPEFANYIGDFSEEFNYDRFSFWLELSIVRKVQGPDGSRASNSKDRALRILPKFLAHSVSARPKLANVVTQPELCMLWCMKGNVKANFARWLVPQFLEVRNCKSLKKVKGLILGPYITRIAMHYNLLVGPPLDAPNPIEQIDIEFLLKAYILRNRDGVLEFTPLGETARDNSLSNGSRSSKRFIPADYEEDETVMDRLDALTSTVDTMCATLDSLARSNTLILQCQVKISKLLEKVLGPTSSSPTPPQPPS